MIRVRPATLVIALSASALAAASVPSRAATAAPYTGVGHHQAVMNNIYRARQRDNAAISHVQNNIRSTRPKTD